jgi:myo-inositol-1(or 4)-monophosphatase
VTADADELLALAVELARAAGALLRDRPTDLGAGTKTTPTDAVTVMDRAAEQLILDELGRRRPRDRVVAEEGGSRPGDSGVTWYVDPLDGTVNYVYDIPHWAVSIGVYDGDVAAAAVVYDGAKDEIFCAQRGAGATCNDRLLRVTTLSDPAMALVGTGFAYDATARSRQAEVLRPVLPRVRDIRRAGSAALDLCSVAAARLDAFFEAGMKQWDWAAGALIVREAGGVVAGLRGAPPGETTTLAAGPGLFGGMEKLLVDAGA